MDVPHPSNFASEGRRILFTLAGVGIAVIVMFLADRLQKHAAKAAPQAPQAHKPAPPDAPGTPAHERQREGWVFTGGDYATTCTATESSESPIHRRRPLSDKERNPTRRPRGDRSDALATTRRIACPATLPANHVGSVISAFLADALLRSAA